MTEADFLSAMVADPSCAPATWLVLADWLEDHDDPRAELVRLLHNPSYRSDLIEEKRTEHICGLIAGGVLPLVPEVVNSIGMRLALIPAGTFLMGSPREERGRRVFEDPVHEVEITRPFYMGVFPVTQKQYERVMGTNPSRFEGVGDLPVDSVSWEDAVDFCEKLTDSAEEQRCGRVYRLPTEAEWEYACREAGRARTPFHYGASLSSTQANFDGNIPYGSAAEGPYLERTTPVGSYSPNGLGLYDMHGNVWEWCCDWYDDYSAKIDNEDPQDGESGFARVLRGGSWFDDAWNCRSAFRHYDWPAGRNDGFGFRVIFCLDR